MVPWMIAPSGAVAGTTVVIDTVLGITGASCVVAPMSCCSGFMIDCVRYAVIAAMVEGETPRELSSVTSGSSARRSCSSCCAWASGMVEIADLPSITSGADWVMSSVTGLGASFWPLASLMLVVSTPA